MTLVIHDANILFLLCFALFPPLPVLEGVGTQAVNIAQAHTNWPNTDGRNSRSR